MLVAKTGPAVGQAAWAQLQLLLLLLMMSLIASCS